MLCYVMYLSNYSVDPSLDPFAIFSLIVYGFEILEMPKHNKIVDKSSSKQLKV